MNDTERSRSDASMLRLSLADPGVQRVLQEWIMSVPGVNVVEQIERPVAGEQGSISALIVTGAASALITAIKVLPEFLRSQRSVTILDAELSDGDRKHRVHLKTEATAEQTEKLISDLTSELKKAIDG
jgi:hypothetical protein